MTDIQSNGIEDICFTLTSVHPPIKIPTQFVNSTASEYLLERAAFWAGEGRTMWNVDAETGVAHTFGQFESQTRSVASALNKYGMRAGDTLIFMTTDLNTIHIVITGAWRANGIIQCVYPEENEATLLRFVEESRAGFILSDFEQTDLCLAVAAKCKWRVNVITASGRKDGCISMSDLFKDNCPELPILTTKPSDVALITCTSGTTGLCKAAVMTHLSLMHQMKSFSLFPWADQKLNFILSRATHVTGVLYPLGILIVGKTCLTLSKFLRKKETSNMEKVFKAVDKCKPGLISGFPSFLTELVNDPNAKEYDFSSLEVCITAGIQLTPYLEDTLMKLPNMSVVFNTHGMTETCALMSTFDYGKKDGFPTKIRDCPPSSLGKPIPGVAVQIRDTCTGLPLGPHTNGEICVKPLGSPPSYYKNQDATTSAFIDGWFKTGDLGYFDENGFIFMLGRIKETYSYYGNHISPGEIEDVILKHPAVSQAVVVGIQDPTGNELVLRAFVILKVQDGVECDPEEIKLFAHERLPIYKHLTGGVYILHDLPKTKAGKISRALLAKLEV